MATSLRVTAYADRFTVRLPLARDRTVMASDLTALFEEDQKIQIKHVATGVKSPILLALGRRHALRLAIRALLTDRPHLVIGATRPPAARPRSLDTIAIAMFAVIAGPFGAAAIFVMFKGQILFGVLGIGLCTIAGARVVYLARRSG